MNPEEYYIFTVDNIYKWAEKIAGDWNGDDPGSHEDKAHQAVDIMDKCNELKELINGMKEL